MKFPDFERNLKNDSGESPSWFSGVLENLNRLFDYIYEAFRGNISTENLKVQVIEFQSTGLSGFPPQYPLAVIPKKRRGKVVGVFVCFLQRVDGQVWDSLNTVIWHEDNDNIIIDNIQGVAGPLLNVRLLALYE